MPLSSSTKAPSCNLGDFAFDERADRHCLLDASPWIVAQLFDAECDLLGVRAQRAGPAGLHRQLPQGSRLARRSGLGAGARPTTPSSEIGTEPRSTSAPSPTASSCARGALMPTDMGALDGRNCFGCTRCCELLSVAELDKPPMVACTHCEEGRRLPDLPAPAHRMPAVLLRISPRPGAGRTLEAVQVQAGRGLRRVSLCRRHPCRPGIAQRLAQGALLLPDPPLGSGCGPQARPGRRLARRHEDRRLAGALLRRSSRQLVGPSRQVPIRADARSVIEPLLGKAFDRRMIRARQQGPCRSLDPRSQIRLQRFRCPPRSRIAMLMESAADQPAPSVATGDRSRLLGPVPSVLRISVFAPSCPWVFSEFRIQRRIDIDPLSPLVHTRGKKSTSVPHSTRRISPIGLASV